MQKDKKSERLKRIHLYDMQKCIKCNSIFDENVEFHQNHCAAILKRHSNTTKLSDFSFEQNYIFERVLYGSVIELEKPIKICLKFKTVVFMHSKTMKLCKVWTGDYLLIRSFDNQGLFVVFPNDKLKKTTVAFYKQKHKTFKVNEKIIAYEYSGQILETKTICCCIDHKEFLSDYGFKNFLTLNLRNTLIYIGMLLIIIYKNKFVQVLIKNISSNGKPYKCKLKENRNTSTLAANLLQLTINETSFGSFKESSSVIDVYSSSLSESSFYFTPFQSFQNISENSLAFESFESSALNFRRKFFIHIDTEEYFYFSSITKIDLKTDSFLNKSEPNIICGFNFLPGLQIQRKTITDYFKCFFGSDFVTDLPNGMIFHGPSGAGKTCLTDSVVREFCEVKLTYFKISGTDIYIQNYLNHENKLKTIFKEAIKRCPSVIFIDEIDLLCKMLSNNKTGAIENLGQLMDETRSSNLKLLWISTATDLNLVNDTLQKNKRFEINIKFEVPNSEEKKMILQIGLSDKMHNLNDEQLQLLSDQAHGLTGFSLIRMCDEAEHHFGAHCISDEATSETVIDLQKLQVFLKQMKPISAKNDQISFQKVHWSDIGGMETVKKKLQHVVEYPIKYPEVFQRFDINPSRGILLYGPPGCSKTMIAKALAIETQLNFIPIKGSELLSKWVGDSEKAIRNLFKRAKEVAPCILFFDEIDALVSDRGSSCGSDVDKRIVTQLLTEIDGADQLKGVVIVAATNRPDILDPAMLRPGRLDHLIYVPFPDANTREAIFKLKFKSMPIAKSIEVHELVLKTCNYSGAEIVAICHEAAFLALSENWPDIVGTICIERKHFEAALCTILPRIPKEALEFYEMFNSNT